MTDMLSVQGSWEEEKTKDTQAREALGSNESAVVDRLGSPVGLRIPVPWDSPYYFVSCYYYSRYSTCVGKLISTRSIRY